MEEQARAVAVSLLSEAARTGAPLDALPASSKPASVADALAIQDLIVERSGKAVAGWKVSTDPTGVVMYGAIYADDCHPSPAAFSSDLYSLRGIEVEIAYRFTESLVARAAPYSRDELERVLAPFPVFEIVHSRFASYRDTPVLDRLADRMSNGGLVFGQAFSLSDAAAVPVVLEIDGRPVFSGPGQHARVDPFLPALDFVHAVQHRQGFGNGQFITTGTLTGLIFLARGQAARATFGGQTSIALQMR